MSNEKTEEEIRHMLEPDKQVVHPARTEFTDEEIATDPILRYFHYTHLPPTLRDVSREFARLARHVIDTVPRNAERSAGLRKLLEAKDCAVRAVI